MIIYNRYINQEDHVWYDSSNVVYSKFYDTNESQYKTLKIVFKAGRTYLYKDVDANDYLMFKNSQSSGDGFNKYIKKYTSVRIADTNMEKLNELREEFSNSTKETEEKKLGDVVYKMKVNEKTGEFTISIGDKVLFRGIEGKVSIVNLFASLNIKYQMEVVDELPNESDELLEEIKF